MTWTKLTNFNPPASPASTRTTKLTKSTPPSLSGINEDLSLDEHQLKDILNKKGGQPQKVKRSPRKDDGDGDGGGGGGK